jgi:Circularly permutated YpsA SLOG family
LGCLRKIVSGGQTGVDQAALRVALACGVTIGGWCPPGRICEGGTIPDIFPLEETMAERSQDAPAIPRSQRTQWNVRDSDATLVLWPRAPRTRDPGTLWASDCASRYQKPILICDPAEDSDIAKAAAWIVRNNIATLNVAGPSEGTSPGIGTSAERFIRNLLFRSGIIRTF